MSKRTNRPSGEYTGAAVERVPNELPDNPAGGCGLHLVDEADGSKSADDLAAELDELLAASEELLAASKVTYDFPEPAQYNDSDSRGDDAVQDALPDSPPDDVGPQRLEDAHIGERIAKDHLQEFLHAKGFGWLKFDGRRWKPVEETIVSEIVRQALIDFYRSEAQSGAEPGRLQQISRLLSAHRIRAITYIAKLCRTTEVTLDSHPDLLNVRNGVVDLRDGILRPHDPGVLVSSTLRDLVIGSGLEFEERGAHQLKGVPGEWHLSAVTST